MIAAWGGRSRDGSQGSGGGSTKAGGRDAGAAALRKKARTDTYATPATNSAHAPRRRPRPTAASRRRLDLLMCNLISWHHPIDRMYTLVHNARARLKRPKTQVAQVSVYVLKKYCGILPQYATVVP